MSEPNPTVDLPRPEAAPPAPAGVTPPQRIGRYRIERLLGNGGFGLVYLAHDDQLQRLVAIKVPHARLGAQSLFQKAYTCCFGRCPLNRKRWLRVVRLGCRRRR